MISMERSLNYIIAFTEQKCEHRQWKKAYDGCLLFFNTWFEHDSILTIEFKRANRRTKTDEEKTDFDVKKAVRERPLVVTSIE